ncbi:hypothetical protein LZZ85_09725 [Terrimonas sp. NA20]|uniref:Transmembrane protein n=1 Tax=Terrimonas ginsenosidimutans TaxID=2908004 RepID=A0ABS9KQG7_9BACT|nr:hypothetical protein [Terrimonas ginsenosidimutans]MCG2614561.1 hypothetical protein [Terrimonas ginsenosidimutans]
MRYDPLAAARARTRSLPRALIHSLPRAQGTNRHTTATALLRLTVVAHFSIVSFHISYLILPLFNPINNKKNAPPFSGLPSSTSPENDGD